MKRIVKLRFDQLRTGTIVSDDIKVFVKPEPHKLSKLEEGRFRLISAVSLVDTFVDRILFGWLGRRVLDSCGRTPCLVGWAPIRGGWHQLNARFKNKPVVCLDKSAWDWTVRPYMVEMWEKFLLELPHNAPVWWTELVRLRFKILFDSAVFRFEDGTRVEQDGIGVMKSGCYLTIILNSLGQSMLHYIANERLGYPAGFRQPYTLGDDTVQDALPELREYVRIIEELGVKVKGAKVQHWVEFAGFAYDGRRCWPAYWQKHLYNITKSQNLSELLRAYQILYVHEPVMYSFIVRLASEVSPTIAVPRMVALDIMDNPR